MFRQITNLQECLPTGSQVNPNLSLAELLTNPGKCAPRNTVGNREPLKISLGSLEHLSSQKNTWRILADSSLQ